MIFGFLVSFLLGNNYQEVDGGNVYIHSTTVVVNNNVLTDRIISVREGLKPLTYEFLWVENDKIVFLVNN